MTIRMLHCPDLPPFSNVGISHAVRIGDTVYTSGQIAIDAQGKLVGAGDAALQTRRIYQIIESILKAEGGSLDSIVKLLTFYTEEGDFPAIAAVRCDFFSRGYMPASSSVAVKALAFAGAIVEVEAIAIVPPR
jgi:enamine deaminase RidA (YjgF/YER057c/UK114 family)